MDFSQYALNARENRGRDLSSLTPEEVQTIRKVLSLGNSVCR